MMFCVEKEAETLRKSGISARDIRNEMEYRTPSLDLLYFSGKPRISGPEDNALSGYKYDELCQLAKELEAVEADEMYEMCMTREE